MEQLHIVRQVQPVIDAARPVIIVVSRRNQHRDFHLRQSLFHRCNRFRIDLRPVKQIPRQQHCVTSMAFHQLHQSGQHFPLLRPAPNRQFLRQSLKGSVQMQVGTV